jgi:hypothetical protein
MSEKQYDCEDMDGASDSYIRRIAQLQKEVNRYYWTNEKPTKEGWYWYFEVVDTNTTLTSIVQVVDITMDEDVERTMLVFKGGEEVYLSNMNGYWAGPLVPPAMCT